MVPGCLQCRAALRFVRLRLTLAELAKRNTEVVLRPSPKQRHTLALVLLESGAVCRDRLLQVNRALLTLADHPKRDADIILRHGPLQRNSVARPFQKRCTICRNSICRMRRPALSPAELT